MTNASPVRLSIPFTPPSPEYVPVKEIARRLPQLTYQVYFANPKSTDDLDVHVRNFSKLVL